MGIEWTGVAAGAGAALIGSAIMPALGSGLKFMTKSVIKGGLLAYTGGMAFVDQTTKSIESLASEAKAELRAGDRKQAPAKKTKSKPAHKKSQAHSEGAE